MFFIGAKMTKKEVIEALEVLIFFPDIDDLEYIKKEANKIISQLKL